MIKTPNNIHVWLDQTNSGLVISNFLLEMGCNFLFGRDNYYVNKHKKYILKQIMGEA
jgi:hypothetical protein